MQSEARVPEQARQEESQAKQLPKESAKEFGAHWNRQDSVVQFWVFQSERIIDFEVVLCRFVLDIRLPVLFRGKNRYMSEESEEKFV